MALTELETKKLDELFRDVGFEGESDKNKNVEIEKKAENIKIEEKKETLDEDILALLGDTPQSEPINSSQTVEKETYSFLDDPTESKKSRISSRVKQHENKKVIPVENYTLPKNLLFNLNLTEDRLNQLFNDLGDQVVQSEGQATTSFLDEENKSKSKLMSRVKRNEEKDITPIENHTLPKNLLFNLNLPENRLKELFTGLGEQKQLTTDKSNSYLDEEGQSKSRLMSRVKRNEEKEIIPVDNNTLPKTLIFNLNLPESKLKTLIHSIGE